MPNGRESDSPSSSRLWQEGRNTQQSSRRKFVKGLLAGTGALVLGFDPIHRSWVTSAFAGGTAISIPSLDGELFTDAATLATFADDFGHLVHRTPIAVLQPASVADVLRAVKFCRQHQIQVAARGQGHSTGGQSQVQGGLVIDMSTLDNIEQIGLDQATVQGGVLWKDLLAKSIPLGSRPRVVTAFVGLSVGGTLSMGGIGPASYRYGAIVDNVLELDVVTGEGELKTCSLQNHPALFQAVVGGIGQYGIIVRAKVPMESAPPLARNYVIGYGDLATLFNDMNTLTSGTKVDGIYMQIGPDGNGGWVYGINAVKWYSPDNPPNDAEILAGLNFPPPALQVQDMDAYSYDTSVDALFAYLDSIGLYDIPHVWGDVFLPASKTQSYVQTTLAGLTPGDLGPVGSVLLFPVRNLFPDAIAFRLPAEKHVFLFDILTSGSFQDPHYFPVEVAKARAVFEGARAVGGTLYPIGSTPMSKSDWIRQYGPLYPLLRVAKTLFDPSGIMTPGPGIF